jgi:XTP/dITP diphosphohydrolase
MVKLLIATRNEGKVEEFGQLFHDIPYELVSLNDEGIPIHVEETGSTFEENAILKAKAYSSYSGLLTIADDSGLEVDFLEGRPGVKSARYGGDGLSDQERVELLLSELLNVPWRLRSARFYCVIALVSPSGRETTAHGSLKGIIGTVPKGSNGFGYDPVFHLNERGCTTAELSPYEKHKLSHRGQAANKILAILNRGLLTK